MTPLFTDLENIIKPVRIHNIKTDIPEQKIFSRLGYHKSSTIVSDKDFKKIKKVMREGEILCSLSGVYMRAEITVNHNEIAIINENLVWKSSKLAGFLKDSKEIFLVSATAGSKIVEKRDEYLKSGNNFNAVILDAFSSEMAESAVNFIHAYLEKILKKEGTKVTRLRYSPGYGDFSLEYQKDFYSLLDLEKSGISLTESFILIPEKSITAVIGINGNIDS